MSEPPRLHQPRGLLRDLLGEHLDPGYARAAQRRRDHSQDGLPGGRAQGLWLLCGALLVGLLLGVAANDAAARAPGAEQARRGLVEDVREARARTDELGRRASELAASRDAAQADALAGDQRGRAALDELDRLEQHVSAVAVAGPGLRITIADTADTADPASPQQQTRVVLDRDLQLLVNGLWAAGAEAVALSGVRLHPRATIRQAGGAVLVDNRPVSQPYLLEAIGDPRYLHVRFVETDGYGRFATFTQVYGTRFDVVQVEVLRLPAGSPAEPVLARR
ncbi:MAG TPA: DUF881 domain-containing protein [Pseudonocardiaceae bacterium]|nr:DUF881 domain-containing protein [Pseudonocardiaceae bacterium]